MDPQFRRGIFRPQAQRLSISLAPQVGQNSLLLKIQSDLGRKAGYGDLSSSGSENSSGLYSLSASTHIVSAVILTAASARSTASAYSQESPYAPAPPVSRRGRNAKRHGMILEASAQWSDHFQSDGSSGPTTPVSSARFQAYRSSQESPSAVAQGHVSDMHKVDIKALLHQHKQESQEAAAQGKKSKFLSDQLTRKASKSSKAIGKFMNHLSLPSTKQAPPLSRSGSDNEEVGLARRPTIPTRIPPTPPSNSSSVHHAHATNRQNPVILDLPPPYEEVETRRPRRPSAPIRPPVTTLHPASYPHPHAAPPTNKTTRRCQSSPALPTFARNDRNANDVLGLAAPSLLQNRVVSRAQTNTFGAAYPQRI